MTISLLWGSPNAETTLLPQTFTSTRGTALDLVFARQSASAKVITGHVIKVYFSASRGTRSSLDITALVSGTDFTASLTALDTGGLVARKWYFQAFDDTDDELLSHGLMDLWDNPELVSEGGIPLVTSTGSTGPPGDPGPTGPPGPVGPGGGDAVTSLGLGQFALTTSAELFGVLSDETGSGTGAKAVFSLQPRFITDIGPISNNGAALGTTALGWSALHFAQNAVINVGNGNAVITHSTGVFTVTTGDLRVQVAGTNPLSVATLEGTQTFKHKTYDAPIFTGLFSIPNGAFAPFIVGGDQPTSTMTIQTTTGSPATGADIIFRSSTTEFGRFLNSGILNVATGITTTTAAPGTNTTAVATTAFVQAAVASVQSGLSTKLSCRAATTSNITLSGAQTIDTVSVVAGNRVLVKDQSTAANNGIYVAASGSWARSSDADVDAEVTSGLYTFIEEGGQAGSGWILTTPNPITLGSTPLTFTQFTGSSAYTPGAGISIVSQVISVDQGFSPTWSGNHTFSNIITGSVTGNAATVTGLTLAGGSVTLSGGHAITITTTGATGITLPTSGTLATTSQIPARANPSASVGLTAVNGSASTFMSSDSAPALDVTIAPTWTGVHTFTPAARSLGSAAYLTINAPADTNLTASAEAIGVNFVGATRQHATGALATQREYVFNAPTLSFAGASTVSDAATVAIAGPPAAGTNATITRPWAFWVQSGISKFAGRVFIGTNGVSGSTVGDSQLQVLGTADNHAVFILAANSDGHSNGLIIRSNPLEADSPLLVQNNTSINLLSVTGTGNLVVGSAALATNAVAGFPHIPSCAGTPTGTPTAYTGRIPIIVDSTNDLMYFYRGSWKIVGSANVQGTVNGRLTTETGVAVSTSDRTAQGTVYWTAYGGNQIELYDGTNWALYTFSSDISLALSVTSGKNYDVFIYNNAGTLTLELSAAWTTDTARADALTTQNGINVKSGSTTRRHVGTIRASGTNTTEDSVTKRFVWNAYSRVSRPLFKTDTTSTWTYTTDTWRQVRATATNQVEVVVGLSGLSMVNLNALNIARNSQVGPGLYCGIGEDSTSAVPANSLVGEVDNPVIGGNTDISANYRNNPTLGYHYYAWLERSQASGTTTWFGASSGNFSPGIHGTIEC